MSDAADRVREALLRVRWIAVGGVLQEANVDVVARRCERATEIALEALEACVDGFDQDRAHHAKAIERMADALEQK